MMLKRKNGMRGPRNGWLSQKIWNTPNPMNRFQRTEHPAPGVWIFDRIGQPGSGSRFGCGRGWATIALAKRLKASKDLIYRKKCGAGEKTAGLQWVVQC